KHGRCEPNLLCMGIVTQITDLDNTSIDLDSASSLAFRMTFFLIATAPLFLSSLSKIIQSALAAGAFLRCFAEDFCKKGCILAVGMLKYSRIISVSMRLCSADKNLI
ncbi:MAG: hypothetical protein IJ639_01770, partial [Ruminococcus sp.]|nr:hypothetical protein [Ruminococcus sp.]